MDWHDRFTLIKDDPSRVISIYYFLAEQANSRINRRRNSPEGHNVVAADWDTLLLLDGCRYDLFESTNNLPGELSSVRSRGSFSEEYLQRNFVGKELQDTVYVTANPYADILEGEVFHDVIDVLSSDWDSGVGTVLPDIMCKRVQEAHDKYPNKRIIGHFMQPHYPFLGATASQLKQPGIADDRKESESVPDIWRQLQFSFNGVSSELVWKAYRETLEITLDELKPWVTELDGKVVISSDHGNLMGEWIGPIPTRGYGHPPSIFHDMLLNVPWLELPSEGRRTIKSESPEDYEITSATTEQLSDLGYR
jgi:hypothetical protein